MKLKNQFLRLFALLGLSMAATSAWAASVSLTPNVNGDYVVVPKSGTDQLEISSDVETFKVYEFAGPESFTDKSQGYLLLTAPEGYILSASGKITRNETENGVYPAKLGMSAHDGGDKNDTPIMQALSLSIGQVITISGTTTGRNMLIYFWSDWPGSSTPTACDGLDLTVRVVFSNAVIGQSGTSSHTVPAGKKQFEVQVPANVGNIDNTTTLTAPEGYVLYVANTTTPNGGSMTVDGNLSSTLTVHVTTESSGFASALNVPVHVLKKTTSTTAIDIYTQDDNGYAVAKITDGEYENSGAVSIPSAINVDAIVYDRVFTANKAGTIVLPFSLPSSATTNAKFYYLKNVLQVEGYCKWKATFRNINLINVTLPADNTPYAVIVPEAELKFNLNGGQATFQTKTIADQVEIDGNKNWIFKGTYQYKLWGANDPEVGLAYALAAEDGSNYTAGQYVKVGTGAYAVPMRAYVRKVNFSVELEPLGRPLAKGEVSSIENLPEVIDAEFVDENEKTTAIGRLNTVTGAIKIDRWFDLKGRSTNHKPTTKGAFFNKKGIAK